jgi:hypothetical protein
MANKRQHASMAKIMWRLSYKQIPNSTVCHAGKTKTHCAFRETKNIPMQVLLNVIMYLVKHMVDLCIFFLGTTCAITQDSWR